MPDFLIRKNFTMHSGAQGTFKIECDALTDEEINTFAYLISERIRFGEVKGIPRGGIRIANALEKYVTQGGSLLLVDDVYTTGTSMRETAKYIKDQPVIGVVMFARAEIKEPWIHAVFQLWEKDHG